ncbi:unnamed protein product [Amoebophrya sp. A120]|nr:unnamed protein product [Amoebophrya sp. A120]|eukprot:GSA120T00000350001.1
MSSAGFKKATFLQTDPENTHSSTYFPTPAVPEVEVADHAVGLDRPRTSTTPPDVDGSLREHCPSTTSPEDHIHGGDPLSSDSLLQAALRDLRNFKVQLHMRPISMAPKLKNSTFSIDGFITFGEFFRKMKQLLRVESLYLYLQSSFTPERDDCIADLYNCFKGPGDQLVFSYSLEPSYS